MSKTVTFTDDVYPYCVGDVIVLNDEELKQVDKIAKARKHKVYTEGSKAEVDSSDEADRQAADREVVAANDAEATAQRKLEDAAAAKQGNAPHNNSVGKDVPGTSAGTTVKTAAAK